MKNMKKLKSQAGFTLIELMVVVAIVGILAAIGLPRIQGLQQQARQAEANQNLGVLHTLAETYSVQNNGYTGMTLAAMGWQAPNGANYTYALGGTITQAAFTGTATAPQSSICTNPTAGANNVFQVDQTRSITQTTACP